MEKLTAADPSVSKIYMKTLKNERDNNLTKFDFGKKGKKFFGEKIKEVVVVYSCEEARYLLRENCSNGASKHFFFAPVLIYRERKIRVKGMGCDFLLESVLGFKGFQCLLDPQ